MLSTKAGNPLNTAVTVVVLFLAMAAKPYAQVTLSEAFVLPGVYISYNMREGYRKFDSVDKYQHVANTNPFIFGAMIGRRLSIDNPLLRFLAAFEFGYGAVKDGEYDIDVISGGEILNIAASLHSVYWTGGLLAEAHLLFPLEDGRTIYISAGPGAHLTYFDTRLKNLDDGQTIFGGSGGLRASLSPSVNLGCGIEYKISNRRAASICYNLRFWQSANYKETGGLFPMGVDYTEFFFTHTLRFQLLLPGRSDFGR